MEQTKDPFAKASETIDAAVKASAKLQEDAWKWWNEALGQANTTGEQPAKIKEVLDAMVPTAKRSAEATLTAVDQISKSGLDLLTKAFDATPGDTEQIRNQVQDVWDRSLAALRKNTETLVQANEQMITVWSSSLERLSPEGQAKAGKTGKTGKTGEPGH